MHLTNFYATEYFLPALPIVTDQLFLKVVAMQIWVFNKSSAISLGSGYGTFLHIMMSIG